MDKELYSQRKIYYMEWIINNKEWLFSGIGVFTVSTIIGFMFNKKNSTKQTQKSGKNSTNYQSGRDIIIKDKDAE